jgi:hypothetical protein
MTKLVPQYKRSIDLRSGNDSEISPQTTIQAIVTFHQLCDDVKDELT